MKKFLSILLMLALILSATACGNKPADEEVNAGTEIGEETQKPEKEEKEEVKEDKKEENKKEETKKEEDKKEESKPETKPEVKPETTPETKPESPSQPEESDTVGLTLLSAFKSQSNSQDAYTIAKNLISNPIIPFPGDAVAVEPGLLPGFDNAEITGFKEGAMFAPMIGTIPFVGYVFTLESGVNSSDFIATLKASANLRWNICTSADEMVTGSSGDKVFFVMSPISFEEE